MKKYYFLSLSVVLLASFYPLKMGLQIMTAVLRDGYVLQENYPKYVIPYTPISLAIITGVFLMPLLIRFAKKYALLVGSSISVGTFFTIEHLFENLLVNTTVAVTKTVTEHIPVELENWQMFMCYIPTDTITHEVTTNETVSKTAVEILMGNYSPTFKIHFYIISIVLILSFLNCIYGFAHMIKSKDFSRLESLVLQAVSAVLFLALCIFACFTAFFRTGEILVSPISAFLMMLFFIVFGITMGIYTESFLIGKRKTISLLVPSFVASLTTLAMYIGEMCLLSGNLYRFGQGCFFDGIRYIVLAPVDILVIVMSFVLTYIILSLASKHK